jgi:hypothetical protein
MTASSATEITAARPGFTRRRVTSSLTYTVPSQPVNMNTAARKPPTRSPLPPMPDRLSQPRVTGTVPRWWFSTSTRPAAARPSRIAYSTTAMPTWVRAVIRMPTTAITSTTSPRPVAIPTFPQVLVALSPKMASTLGPSTSTPLTVAMTYAAIISHPVKKPR